MDFSTRLAAVGLVTSLAVAGWANKSLAHTTPNDQRIEVTFVLDTTGSMANLIDGAKRKIWSIANTIIDINPDARIKMALVGYRDVGDEYVVKTFDMSSDIQGLYGNLTRFVADGGGDTPESVNEALAEGVRKIGWSDDSGVRKILFLVGDAPPHMDYANGPKYRDVIAKARDKGIIVNTVQAGSDPETAQYWQEMARLGEGKYFAIPQDGGQIQVIHTPYDDEIIKIQGKIDGTIIIYGDRAKQAEISGKLEDRASAPADAKVDSSRYYSKKSGVKEVVTGGGDLVDAIRNRELTLDKVQQEQLPISLQGKQTAEIKAIVDSMTEKRTALEAEMSELLKKRDAHVAAELATKPAITRDSFDSKVSEALSQQF